MVLAVVEGTPVLLHVASHLSAGGLLAALCGGLRRASQGAKVKATEYLDASVPELTQPHFHHILLVQATPQNQFRF